MNEVKKNLLTNLVLISREDSALGRIRAERKKAESEIAQTAQQLKKAELEAQATGKVLDEKRRRYANEDNKIRDERDKPVLRRKALSSLNNYKLQQSAEKEIENSSRELDQHEESLIAVLEEVDRLAENSQKAAALVAELSDKHAELIAASKDLLASLEEREKQHLDEKMRLLPFVDSKSLALYQRVVEKYPLDAVVPLKQYTCGGCFMHIGPQATVQIGRDDSIVRCRGCGRILYLDEQKNREESGG